MDEKRAVLFDLEGTLVETKYQRISTLAGQLNNETKQMLLGAGIPKKILNNITRSAILRNTGYQWAWKNLEWKGLTNLKEKIESFMKPYDISAAKEAVLYPDSKFVLEEIKIQGIEMGIVTNTSGEASEYILNKCKIKDYFKVNISRDDVIFIKPNPYMIFLAASKMNKLPEYLIGDSRLDAKAAYNANLGSIIIRRRPGFPDHRFDHWIKSLTEVLEIMA